MRSGTVHERLLYCMKIDTNTNINPNIDSESSPTLSPSTAIAQVCQAPASPDNLAA